MQHPDLSAPKSTSCSLGKLPHDRRPATNSLPAPDDLPRPSCYHRHAQIKESGHAEPCPVHFSEQKLQAELNLARIRGARHAAEVAVGDASRDGTPATKCRM